MIFESSYFQLLGFTLIQFFFFCQLDESSYHILLSTPCVKCWQMLLLYLELYQLDWCLIVLQNLELKCYYQLLVVILGGGQMYMWGKMKTTGDDWMYPKPLMDLRFFSNF
jgi:hypothetical protein